MFEVQIPEISDEELMKRYKQIKPVITFEGKLHCFREYTLEELRKESYFVDRDSDMREEVEEGKLEVMVGRDFACLHTYGYPGFFRPSIAEVLSQIARYDLPYVRAFEIIEYPQSRYDFEKDSLTYSLFNKGYHVSTVRLYGEKK